jgi:hypothetical protein
MGEFRPGIAGSGIMMAVLAISLAATGLALTARPHNLRLRPEVATEYSGRVTKDLTDPGTDPNTYKGAESRFTVGRFFTGLSVAGAVIWMILCIVGITCQAQGAQGNRVCTSSKSIYTFVGKNMTGALTVGTTLILMAMIGNIALYTAGYTVVGADAAGADAAGADATGAAPAPDTIAVAGGTTNHLDGVRIASIAGITLAIGVGVGVGAMVLKN